MVGRIDRREGETAFSVVSKLLKTGAGDGDRTRDMQLGKLPFYH